MRKPETPYDASMTNEWVRADVHGVSRCWWPGDDAQYIEYHDSEWGRPVSSDTQLFENLCLEGYQSGWSWRTILRTRDNFRNAFKDFDMEAVAKFGQRDIERLMNDAGIVRHRGKIEATINNAQRALELQANVGALSQYIWSYAPSEAFGRDGTPAHDSGLATTSPSATALSKDLKRRGWKFVGPTTVYSFMQSMGLINDHLDGCHVQHECEQLRLASRFS
jgi:DNA-3-methyladenine glycosylase I